MKSAAVERSLTEPEQIYVNSILAGATNKSSSEAAGITQNTGSIWRRKPHIAKALLEGEEAAIAGRMEVTQQFHAERTRITLPAIADKLSEAVVQGVDVVIGIMRHGKRDSDRLAAFDRLTKLSGLVEQQTLSHVVTDTTPRQKGLSPEAVAEIKRKVLGCE
jgi:hypothetical protein